MNMNYFKLQCGCLLLVMYVIFMYQKERRAYKIKKRDRLYELLLVVGVISIVLDGITAYTVNHTDTIPKLVNDILHVCFLCSLDAIVFVMFMYIKDIIVGIPKQKNKRLIIRLPFVLGIIVVVLFSGRLEYREGEITNYSMGISAYTCYVMVAIYMLATIYILFTSRMYFGRHKAMTITTFMLVEICVAVYQMLFPESLVSCLVPTFAIIGTYLNMENPLYVRLKAHNQEMVMGFATLVENRDGSTGGHIRRTTEYARMLANELRMGSCYANELTRDYIKNLIMAAPMHDVGKIAIPDAILQKPGRLTAEEYDIMKTHSEKGGNIIKGTFGSVGDDEYGRMAYEVARYHHEKWNGRGYPEGKCKDEIPLCARIMAVADVFDAVSAKRCYRDALPLDECFDIIEKGVGEDFDPVIANTFLGMRSEIEAYLNEN